MSEDTDIQTLSYEQARAELAEVVRTLETGTPSLEESLRLYKRGEDLAALCQHWLDSATADLDAAIAARSGDTDGDTD
jgi:exodeoxyribonuclease VII small subunit